MSQMLTAAICIYASVCMPECMYASVCVHECMYASVCVHECMYTSVCMHECMYASVCVHECMYASECISHVDMSQVLTAAICVYASVCMHQCTGRRRLTGCLELQVIFRKRTTNYRALQGSSAKEPYD